MAAGEPGILVDDAADRIPVAMIGALPQRPEGAAGGNDRIAEDAELGGDLGHAIGHAGTAGHAVDQPFGALEDALQNPRRRRCFPEDVHVEAAAAAGGLMGDPRLVDAAPDRVGNQLLITLTPRLPSINLGNDMAGGVEKVGVDAGKRADAPGFGERSRAEAGRDGYSFPALDDR